MVATKKKFYTVTVTTGTGQRVSRGRFRTKAEAMQKLKSIKRSRRSDADTGNPRIKSFMGFI